MRERLRGMEGHRETERDARTHGDANEPTVRQTIPTYTVTKDTMTYC